MRRLWFLWVLALFCACLLLPHAAIAQSPAQLFQQAKTAYTAGDYELAVKQFRKLLYPKPGILKSKFMRQQSHRLLGISYYYLYTQILTGVTKLKNQNKPVPKKLLKQQRLYLKRARFELLEYLINNPSATLSPLIYPLDLGSLFNKLKNINQLRLNALKLKKARRKTIPVQVIHTRTEKRTFETSPFAMLLPCGLAQMANGHTVKGVLVLIGCTGALTTNLASYGVLMSNQTENGRFDPAFVSTARALRVTHFVAFGALAALVIYGYVDGIYYFTKRRESLLPRLPIMSDRELGQIPVPPGSSGLMREQFR